VVSETDRQIAQLRVGLNLRGILAWTDLLLAPQAQIDALEEANKKRKAEEEDTKPQIIERMGKKLKVAKEEDGGFVDLTGDDE
jgi:hypothetical protein